MALTGGCRCGATRYRLALDAPPAVHACHCLDCQTWSGSAFAENAMVPADAIAVEGPTAGYAHETPSGFAADQTSCAVCRTRILIAVSAMPGMVCLHAGTLDASDRLAPFAHMWVRRKQPWLRLPEGVVAWQETPTPEAYRAALPKG